MFKLPACAAVLAILCGCANVQKVNVSEITRDVKSVSFVQNGRQPGTLTIGAVDGTTSWSNAPLYGTPSNPNAKADVAGAALLTLTSLVGKAIADADLAKDPQYYNRLLTQMVEGRELSFQAGQTLLPAMARAWGVPFEPARLVLLPSAQDLHGKESNRYLGEDTGADLVLTFTLQQLLLSEKPSARGLKSLVSFGLYDKEVMPFFTGEFSAYRRLADGGLERVWTTQCRNTFLDAPAEEWTVLRDDPQRAIPLLDKTLPRFIDGCSQIIQRQLAPAA